MIDFSAAAIFNLLGIAVLSSFRCRNSSMVIIKTMGINQRFYPQKYVAPRRWQKRLFKFERRMIPRYIFNELCMSVFFAVLGPVNVFIYVVLTNFNESVLYWLMTIHIWLVLLDAAYFLVMTFQFRRK